MFHNGKQRDHFVREIRHTNSTKETKSPEDIAKDSVGTRSKDCTVTHQTRNNSGDRQR
jgi:hypothetical protein